MYKTPYVAALFVGILSIILVAIFEQLGVDAISRLVNFGALTAFMMLNLTIIWHFFYKKRTGNVGRHLILPLIGFLIIAYVWFNLDSLSKTMGLIWLVCGGVYYLVLTKVLKKDVSMEV